ncbi:MAG TPA: MFS transporter [Castellaniella sp.]|uniref:MFS transporter n=1 Tax=Castellaniella sp. TaxID=1955812 RepID=UPI002EE63E34
MNAIDQTIVATALDTLQKDLDAPISWVAWTITIYALGMLLFVPVAGKLCEQHGHRRVFQGSIILFTLASLSCGLSNDIYTLVALRFVQAVGVAGFYPAATGLIVTHLGSDRDRALGLFGSMFPIGAMIGPIFGGLFVTYWSWRGIFFVNVPIGIVLSLLTFYFVPVDIQQKQKREPMDFKGMTQLGAGMLCLMLAFNGLSGGGHQSTWLPDVVLPTVLGLIAFALFIRHSRVTAQPFIPGYLMGGPGFRNVNLINFGGGTVVGIISLIPLYAASRYGISALGSGTILTVEGLIALPSSALAVLTLRKTGYHSPIYAGLATIGLGTVMLAVPPWGLHPYLWLAIAAALIGFGAGWLSPASRNAGFQLAPDRAPTLAALRTMAMQIGAIVSISITTAVIANASNPGLAHAWAYVGWGGLLLVMMTLVAQVPEHHGAW